MKCERCQQIKEEIDFNHGKEDSICESCCEKMLLGGGPSFQFFEDPEVSNKTFVEQRANIDLREYAHLSMGMFDPQLHYAIENERSK